jgi:hypothetical protein
MPDRAATLISKAEQRIFERYLEVAASPFDSRHQTRRLSLE